MSAPRPELGLREVRRAEGPDELWLIDEEGKVVITHAHGVAPEERARTRRLLRLLTLAQTCCFITWEAIDLARDWWRGAVLSKARKRAGLTQAALAKKVHVHQVTIARLETGARRPSMRMLQRLAKALGVPVGELLA